MLEHHRTDEEQGHPFSVEQVGNTYKIKFHQNQSEYQNVEKEFNEQLKKVPFHVKNLKREVINSKKKKRYQWLEVAKKSIPMLSGILMYASPAAAQTVSKTAEAVLMPAEMIQILLAILMSCIIIAIGIALVGSVLAGVCRMFRKHKFAQEWSNDIIRGLIQVLLMPLAIFCIILLFHSLFGNLEWYIDPARYLPTFQEALETLFPMQP
ncbi:hypothetical protein E8M24_26380 [Bacillus thuringiensis]|uniref:hypothetical protein n=1 Tax=Bacillus thuringiensis TaxID=1428 RepID=UPI00125F195E|nr:hypothetical protein [Bacillus thuringiensis]KAB5635723.1 hypothetical protein E8M24_26380 [Bacillus thuringiensis]HDR5270599.1 hypothetical protein [Bacillus thuringiensis]